MTKFFTLSDARYFLGTVALINSIRITGHPEPVVVLDCGLTDAQRTLIDAECTIVPLPADARAAFASSFKAIAPLQHADDVVVLVDSDMVITRNVEELIAQATEGKFVAYPDPDVHRFFAEWEQIFQLPRAPRPAPYVNAGFMVFSTRRYPTFSRGGRPPAPSPRRSPRSRTARSAPHRKRIRTPSMRC